MTDPLNIYVYVQLSGNEHIMLTWVEPLINRPLLHVPITKYKVIPNPNPNPNTKMTVDTIPRQM